MNKLYYEHFLRYELHSDLASKKTPSASQYLNPYQCVK